MTLCLSKHTHNRCSCNTIPIPAVGFTLNHAAAGDLSIQRNIAKDREEE